MIAIDHSDTLEYKSYSILLLLNLFSLYKNNGISFVCVCVGGGGNNCEPKVCT